LAIASAFWFYVMPQSPKPSMHDAVTGFWQPNTADTGAGINLGFGATININGGLECNKIDASATARTEYFTALMGYFSLTIDATETDNCRNMASWWPETGAAVVPSYFNAQGTAGEQCSLVAWQTPYSAHVAGDYKRCVVAAFGGNIVQPILDCWAHDTTFNYLPGDKVCDASVLYSCVADENVALGCKANAPGQGVTAWVEVVGQEFAQVSSPTVSTAPCKNYDAAIVRNDLPVVRIGDLYCDADRVWSCDTAATCLDSKPSTDSTNWTLKR